MNCDICGMENPYQLFDYEGKVICEGCLVAETEIYPQCWNCLEKVEVVYEYKKRLLCYDCLYEEAKHE